MTTKLQPVPIIYFGSSQPSADILEYLLTQPGQFEVRAVVTRASKEHAHRDKANTAVATIAKQAGLLLLQPLRAGEICDQLRALQPAVAILFAYGQILPQELIDVFPQGIVNIHPSLLPAHRGPSPIEATILAGDNEAGTSIMLIDAAMDAGPILVQKRFSISQTITKRALTDQLVAASQAALVPTVLAYLRGEIVPQPQDDAEATYCKLIKRADSQRALAEETAESLERAIRAYSEWPIARLEISDGRWMSVHEARQVSVTVLPNTHPGLYQHQRQLIALTSNGALELRQVQLPGKTIISGSDAANGLRLPALPILIEQ